MAWSPDGRYLSAGSADKYLYIWDYEDSKIAYKLPGHLGSINDVAFHPAEPISKLNISLIEGGMLFLIVLK